MSWPEAVGAAVKAVAIPYGYTLAIWASGMLATSHYGIPRFYQVLAFVLGATAGYLLFDLLTLPQLAVVPTFTVRLPSLAVVNFLPVLPALGAALASREIANKTWGFLTMGAVASIAYILSLTVLIWITGHLVPLV